MCIFDLTPKIANEFNPANNTWVHLKFGEDEGIEAKRVIIQQKQTSADGLRVKEQQLPFEFDLVFRPDSTQKQVFEEISQLVQSALDGYPVCIFAYGQTGSGKTFTMEGPMFEADDELSGMIPRSVKLIFMKLRDYLEKGWEYTIEVQFLEIYNEKIKDLLNSAASDHSDVKYDIKHQGGKTFVTNLTTVVVDKPEKVEQLLQKARKNRAVGATLCNEHSSRSHRLVMQFRRLMIYF